MAEKATSNLKWQVPHIDDISELSINAMKLEDLQVIRGTGASAVIGSGENRRMKYRTGLQTTLGDIREDVWIAAAKQVVAREKGETLFPQMKEFIINTGNDSIRQPESIAERIALEFLVDGVENDPEWEGYEEFRLFASNSPKKNKWTLDLTLR